MKKYKLTDETITVERDGKEVTLHRIEALRDFGNIKAGDLGGFVKSEKNLSHNGDCWVYGNAKVCDNAWIYGSAEVYDNANIYGCAKVGGTSKVCGDTVLGVNSAPRTNQQINNIKK